MGRALIQQGLEPTMACPDGIPGYFDYLPGADLVVSQPPASFDLIITLDSSDLGRLGGFASVVETASVPVLNVDHHVTNTVFGDVNLVDSMAASTAEVVLRLLEALDASLDSTIARCLMTGLVTDTRGFRTNNVTPQTMEAALRLMRAGASLPEIAHHALDRRSIAAMRLWGAALSEELQLKNRVIWSTIPRAMRRAVGYPGEGDAQLASFLSGAIEADVSVVFIEQAEGDVDVSLRADPGFDVAEVAIQFGGGGHALAAGCQLGGPLEEARERFLNVLWAELERQRGESGSN